MNYTSGVVSATTKTLIPTFQSMWLELSTPEAIKESNVALQELNDAEFFRRLAPVIYLSILIVIGIPGNALVFCIYKRHFKKSVHRVFIMSLALTDFAVCVLSLPFEIIEMRFQYTFYEVVACKFFRANNNFLNLCSIFLIVGMSIDRYRRVCHPLKSQLTIRAARFICAGAILLSLLFSWPNFLLSGTRHVKLANNITGFDCSRSDAYAKTKFPFVYNAILFLVFIVVITTLIVVYSCIGRKIYAHGRFRSRFTSSRSSRSTLGASSTSSSSCHEALSKQNNLKPLVSTTKIAIVDCSGKSDNVQLKSFTQTKSSGQENRKTAQVERTTGKITRIAFTISLVFVLSYLPHLILSLMTAVKGRFVAKPGPIVSAVLPIVTRSIFINNVANPFVYGFLDPKFKTACKNQLLCCK